MSKNKEKHHLQEEPPKNLKESDKTPGMVKEVAQGAPAGQEVKPAAELSPADKLAEAEEEIDQLKDQLLRLKADFENFRKRALREKIEVYENANETLMLDLLPVIDHLQIAVKSARENKVGQAFLDGFQLILDQLMEVLSKYGLAPFDSEKKPFDHNLHEAISSLPSETEPENIIIAQSRPGYRFKKKLLRPAQVVVSRGKPALPQPETEPQPAED